MIVILALTGKASDSSDFLYAIEEDLHVPRRNRVNAKSRRASEVKLS